MNQHFQATYALRKTCMRYVYSVCTSAWRLICVGVTSYTQVSRDYCEKNQNHARWEKPININIYWNRYRWNINIFSVPVVLVDSFTCSEPKCLRGFRTGEWKNNSQLCLVHLLWDVQITCAPMTQLVLQLIARVHKPATFWSGIFTPPKKRLQHRMKRIIVFGFLAPSTQQGCWILWRFPLGCWVDYFFGLLVSFGMFKRMSHSASHLLTYTKATQNLQVD